MSQQQPNEPGNTPIQQYAGQYPGGDQISQQFYVPGGMGMVGQGIPGMGAQGMGAQGMGAQGMGAQGMGAQGMGAQGMGAQGMGAQGMPGMGAQGMPGMGAQGMPGMGAQGMPGMGAQGMPGMGAQGMPGMGAQGMGMPNMGMGMGMPNMGMGMPNMSMGMGMPNMGMVMGMPNMGMGMPNMSMGMPNMGMGMPGMGMYGSMMPNPQHAQEITNLKQQIVDKQNQIETLENELDKLKRRTRPLIDYEDLEAKYNQLRNDSKDVQSLSEEINRLKAQVKHKASENEDLEQKLRELRNKTENEVFAWERQTKKLEEQIQNEIGEKLKLNSKIQNLEQSLSASGTQNALTRQQQEKIKELEDEIFSLKQQIGNKQKLLEQLELTDATAKLTQEIQKAQHQIEIEHENYLKSQDLVADQKRKIVALQKDIQVKDESVANLEKMLQKKNRELVETVEDLQNQKQMLKLKDEFNQQLDNQVTELTKQIGELLKQVGSNSTNDKVRQKMKEMEDLKKLQDQQIAEQAQAVVLKKQRAQQAEEENKRRAQEEKKRNEEQKAERLRQAQNLKKRMQESHGKMDVCFLLDCTGSMDPYKEQTKQCVKSTLKSIKELTGRDSSFGVICYQDFAELRRKGKYDQLAFTEDPTEVEKYLDMIKCEGGGDAAEDVRGGIKQMCELKWTKKFKIAILITDAPGHGKEYNGGCGDNHPTEDMRDAVEMMIKNEILFIGINFTKFTEPMFKKVQSIFDEKKRSDLLMVVDMQKVTKGEIWKEMAAKISEAAISSTQTNKKETKSKGDKPTDQNKNKDGAIEALCKAGNFYDFEKQPNVKVVKQKFIVHKVELKERSFKNNIETIERLKAPEDFQTEIEGAWDIIRTEKPFAFGMMKEVYLMKKQNEINNFELYVIKTPLGGKTYPTLPEAVKECRSHLICQSLMRKFIGELHNKLEEQDSQKKYPQVVYSDFLILEESKTSYWIAERFFRGDFVKYNNNYGYISDEQSELNQLAQAFSYWTYHTSGFNYMINDVQGVNIYFTDPAINTKDGKFDETDMGLDGQAMFMVNFETKKQVCKKILDTLGIYPD